MRKRPRAKSIELSHAGGRTALRAGFLAGMLAFGGAQAQGVCEIGGVPVTPSERTTMQGRSGVMRCREGDPPQVVREQDIQNGRSVGAVRYFTAGHRSREQFVNERGNLQGRSREFAPGGQVVREGHYDNGALLGLVRNFRLDGRLQRAGFYTAEGEIAHAEFTHRGELRALQCADRPVLAPAVDDTRLCGFAPRPSQVSFVAENGTLRARATFAGGRRMRYETFQDNGFPATQEELLPIGRVERFFGADGIRRREVLWTPGENPRQREREQEFSSTGVLTRERHWSQGELLSEQTFHENGQPRSKARYVSSGSTRTLQTQDFYPSGQLSGEGSYVDTGRYAPTPVGTHRQFDLQGRVRSESVYDFRGRLLRDRIWEGVTGTAALREDDLVDDGARRPPVR